MQEKIIKKLSKSIIDELMTNIGFKFNAQQFSIKKDGI